MDLIEIEGHKHYLDEETGKYIKITPRNWIKVIADWERMDKNWVRRINKEIRKLKITPPIPSLYGIKECAQKGDCMFGCISEALNSDINNDNNYSITDIRKIAASKITPEIYELMSNCYKVAYEENEINWDPTEINSIEELKELISEPETIWGDHQILCFLCDALKFNVIIFPDEKSYNNEYDLNYHLYNTTQDFNKNYPTIMLYYIEDIHFQLVGHFNINNGKIMTLFSFEDLPNEIKEIYKNNIRKL